MSLKHTLHSNITTEGIKRYSLIDRDDTIFVDLAEIKEDEDKVRKYYRMFLLNYSSNPYETSIETVNSIKPLLSEASHREVLERDKDSIYVETCPINLGNDTVVQGALLEVTPSMGYAKAVVIRRQSMSKLGHSTYVIETCLLNLFDLIENNPFIAQDFKEEAYASETYKQYIAMEQLVEGLAIYTSEKEPGYFASDDGVILKFYDHSQSTEDIKPFGFFPTIRAEKLRQKVYVPYRLEYSFMTKLSTNVELIAALRNEGSAEMTIIGNGASFEDIKRLNRLITTKKSSPMTIELSKNQGHLVFALHNLVSTPVWTLIDDNTDTSHIIVGHNGTSLTTMTGGIDLKPCDEVKDLRKLAMDYGRDRYLESTTEEQRNRHRDILNRVVEEALLGRSL